MAAPIPQVPGIATEHQTAVWAGRSSVSLIRFRRARFGGATSRARTWEVLRRGSVAAVPAYDPWTEQVVLFDQFRVAAVAAGLDPVITEVLAGLTDGGETPQEAADRAIVGQYPDSVTTIALLWLAAQRPALRAEWLS